MTKQLSDCCKAEIKLTGKQRPNGFACTKCGRIIGTPMSTSQMSEIDSVILQNVEVQENGIIRNEKGRFIARLCSDVEYESEHIRGCAMSTSQKQADEFFSLNPKYRTKEKLAEMISLATQQARDEERERLKNKILSLEVYDNHWEPPELDREQVLCVFSQPNEEGNI